MRIVAPLSLLVFLCLSSDARAEILIRWSQDRIPSRESLGITTVVVPAASPAAVQSALQQGYRVYLETQAAKLGTVPLPLDGLAGVLVKGPVSAAQLRQLKQRLKSRAVRVLTIDERGKWPHIRSNWVTKNDDVLQVSGRTAQPWIENNAALLRILEQSKAAAPADGAVITYEWKPITLAEQDEGPALENYLVAMAEAGSFGGDLLLPLHERFQKDLLLGTPRARAGWGEIRRYLEFYGWDLAAGYQRSATVGVVTAEPLLWYEVLNLLGRHNVPFHIYAPAELSSHRLNGIKLLIVLDEPAPAVASTLAEFERSGGIVKVAGAIADPDGFALDMRRILGPEHRAIDIWNGITILAAPFKEPDGNNVLVTAVNYAHEALPIQLRIPGAFRTISYESPEDAPALLPFRHRDGHTEFVLPAIRIGARVFLSR